MKRSSFYLFLSFIGMVGNVLGQVTFQTTNGVAYEDVTVLSTNDHSVVIKHDGKRIYIPFGTLSDEVRDTLELDPLILARYDFQRDVHVLKNSLRLLDDDYEAHLRALRDEFRKSGNREGVIAIEEESKNYASGNSKQTRHPRLERVKGIYKIESIKLRNQNLKKLKAVLEKYISTLEREQTNLMIEKKLDSAIDARIMQQNAIEMLANLSHTFQTLVVPGPADSGLVLDKVPRLGPDPTFGEHP